MVSMALPRFTTNQIADILHVGFCYSILTALWGYFRVAISLKMPQGLGSIRNLLLEEAGSHEWMVRPL